MNVNIKNGKRNSTLMLNNPWLFNSNVPVTDIGDYIPYWERLHKCKFFNTPVLTPYKFDILSSYKDNVFNTNFVITQTGVMLQTVIQMNTDSHALFVWAPSDDNNETILYATLYLKELSNYLIFLEKNKEFIHDETATSGFNLVPTPQRSGFGG